MGLTGLGKPRRKGEPLGKESSCPKAMAEEAGRKPPPPLFRNRGRKEGRKEGRASSVSVEMEKSAFDHLLAALEDLGEDGLKRFKRKLHDFPVKEGYDNIPKGRLEKADPLDLADLLLSFYAEGYAAEVAAQVLRDINCKPQAQRLLSRTASPGGCSYPKTSVPSVSATSGKDGSHFIDRYREDLIKRYASIEPVLDRLYSSVLTEEQYQKICAKETNPEKMRELYKLVPSWDTSCKDKLYEALKAQNPYLIGDLEGR